MAQRSFSLPALKLNKAGSKSVSYLPRTLPRKSPSLQIHDQLQEAVTLCVDSCIEMSETPPLEEPTAYELKRKAAIVGWEQIRRKMLCEVVEAGGRFNTKKCNQTN